MAIAGVLQLPTIIHIKAAINIILSQLLMWTVAWKVCVLIVMGWHWRYRRRLLGSGDIRRGSEPLFS